MTSSIRSATNWTFRDRNTDRIVIGQRPNVPLAVWLVCLVVGWVLDPHGGWGTALGVTGTVALVIWAGDEVLRGVNPWRRALGAGVLAVLLLGWSLAG